MCSNLGIYLGKEKVNKMMARVAFWWLFNILHAPTYTELYKYTYITEQAGVMSST